LAEKRKAVEPARRDREQECSGPDEPPHVLRAGSHFVSRPKTVVRDEVVEEPPALQLARRSVSAIRAAKSRAR